MEEKGEDDKETQFDKLRSMVDPDIFAKWDREQKHICTLISESDAFDWSLDPASEKPLRYVGGVDISFAQKYPDVAVAILVVLEYPSMKKVYEGYETVLLDGPYVPGFLAFREAAHLVKLFNQLIAAKPHFRPDVILVDGNGILHTNGCGLASHFGVLINTPTIGIGKTIFFVDGLRKDVVMSKFKEVKDEGGYALLEGDSGRVWGAAYKSKKDVTDPIIVSVGHNISLKTSLDLLKKICKFRIPEPVREADIRSRVIVKAIGPVEAGFAVTNELTFLTSPPVADSTDPTTTV